MKEEVITWREKVEKGQRSGKKYVLRRKNYRLSSFLINVPATEEDTQLAN